jgi:hypothetical protein
VNDLYETLLPHLGHEVEIAAFGMGTGVADLAVPTTTELQCETCGTVILDSDVVDLDADAKS